MSKKDVAILIVDDEPLIRRLLTSALSGEYTCITASNAEDAIALLRVTCFNLVLTDISLGGASGLELCQFIQENCPNTVVVMVSAMSDIEFAIEAMRQGAFDYITKPFSLTHMSLSVKRALSYQALVMAKHRYEQTLEEAVLDRMKMLREANEELNKMIEVLYADYRATLRGLAGALEARDFETRGHSDRVVAGSLRLGTEMGLAANDLIALEQGALLHDIGKIGVPDRILLKPGSLTNDEWPEMREHISHGLRIIDEIEFLKCARPVIGQHHEKYDGSGYPNGLRGEAVHILARIFAVADAFDAMTSDRPYRPAQSYRAARAELIGHSGTHFDPKVVKAFLGIPEQAWAETRESAAAQRYAEQVIAKQDILSFLLSLNRPNQKVEALAHGATNQ